MPFPIKSIYLIRTMLKFMRNKILIPALVLSVLAIFFSFRYLGNGDQSSVEGQNEIVMRTVMGVMQEGHYSPRALDDSFSAKVYKKSIENLDYGKKFFLQSDIDKLSAYEFQIDDQILNGSLEYFQALNDIFVKRVDAAKQFYATLLDKPFSFDGNDSVQLDGEKLAFVNSEDELKQRWRAQLKYNVLAKYRDLKEDDEKKVKDSVGYKAKSFATLEKEARESVAKVQERYFKRLLKFNNDDRFAWYLNAITGAEDPHTTFMQPEDKKKFDEMMSGSFIGIGATLQQQEDGRVKVTSIVTGSPSWKQGRLKPEDIIEKVAQGEEPPVDVVGFDLEEVVKMIRGKSGTEVRLSVKHTDGTSEVIPIVRAKVELEEIFARSAIIEENGYRIGYIYLPEFYADFQNAAGRRCSKDVETEVLKLMSEDVAGIILDLRNNGGGSLTDVVDMVGLFTGAGPVVQVRGSGNQSITLSAKQEKPIYTGPLAILINGNSASASEIMAAAIQDYKRGVIIGANSFGKGTVQKLVPLDQFVSSAARRKIIEGLTAAKGGDVQYDGIGSLKLTIQKFYRIDGGSTQLKGVEPDILLPDAYELIEETGERRDKSALPWDKITPVDFEPFFASSSFAELATLSQKRVSANENFKLIKQTAQRIKRQRDDNTVPLNENKYIAKIQEAKDLSAKLDELDSLATGLKIVNAQADLPKINLDTASVAKNENWLKALKKDVYVAEATNVLGDWIKGTVKVTAIDQDRSPGGAIKSKRPIFNRSERQ
jgi:carboxyl-terminal processing protease